MTALRVLQTKRHKSACCLSSGALPVQCEELSILAWFLIVAGEDMAKTPLVLVPGLLCDDALWKPQIDWLSDIAEPTVGDTLQTIRFQTWRRAFDAAPDRFALAGLSMGGYVCMEIMRKAPERVERLALLDTSGRADSAEQNRRRQGLIELAKIGKFKGVTPRLMPLLIHTERQQDTALTTCVIDMASRVGQKGFLRQQTAIMKRISQLESMRNYGACDGAVRPRGRSYTTEVA